MSRIINRYWWFWTAGRHVLLLALGYCMAWLLRFDFVVPDAEMSSFYRGLAIALVTKMVISVAMGLRLERWSTHQGFPDAVRLLGLSVVSSMASGTLIYAVIGVEFPRSVYILDPLVCFLVIGGARFAARLYSESKSEWFSTRSHKGLLIYGAGAAGLSLAREIRNNEKLGYRVVGFLDDDPTKRGSRLVGLPVFGAGDQAKRVVEECRSKGTKVEEIAVAMPSAPGLKVRAALAKAKAAGVTCRIVPGLGELISGKLSVGKMREISVTDLLGREPVELDRESVLPSVAGRCVLVTGAAGSIGSELCRQLSQLEPRKLVVFDEAESPLFFLESELRAKYPELDLVAIVGDIRDSHHVTEVIENYGIHAIYHAAAFKHVPLMERQVCEAVRNNVIGTWNLVQAAKRANVSNFVLISTDKAVNPSSIMGLTKRCAELIVSSQAGLGESGIRRKYVAVRFGNVLVSNGSVVPIFEKQIAHGGPVMVTHPDMQRYFMTVQEAVHLVLQAGALGQGSEVFLLDMGQPMKILELARNMIRLAGFEPGEDIEIKIAGMRPGEKLFEELSLDNENTIPTAHPKIRTVRGRQMTMHELAPWVAELQYLLMHRSGPGVIDHLSRLVPEYRPSMGEALVPKPITHTSPLELPAPSQSPATLKAASSTATSS